MTKTVLACFMGIDGSGKTTVAKALHESLSQAGISSTYIWCGWRGFESWLFKPFAAFTKDAMIKRGNERGVASAHEKIPFFDYLTWLDYFVRVCPALVTSSLTSTVLVVDRYFYDVVQELHGEGTASRRMVTWLMRLFPQPTVVFYIKVPPELAYVRKDDIPSLEFLQRSEEEKQKLLKELPANRVIVLDGTRTVQELTQDALNIVTALVNE
jgi:thymidylate kinase